MSDLPTPTAEEIEQARALHEQNLEFANEHDPNSVFYRRPDIAAKYRARAQADFDALLARYTPQPEEEPRFELNEPLEALAAEIDARVAALPPLVGDQRELALAKIQRDLGEVRWARLEATMYGKPTVSKEDFVAEHGKAEFEELVRLARLARPTLPPDALADEYTLRTLANVGRYKEAAGNAAAPQTRKSPIGLARRAR